ncbi:MAG: type II toxin-antitoxin system VapC family toxin [Phormidesmis sp.]
MATVIADTGFIVAVANEYDSRHKDCKEVYVNYAEILLPQTTLAEVAYLVEKKLGSKAIARFLQRLPNSRLQMTALTESDISRTAEILNQYADSRIDFVDASVMAMAERFRIEKILTIDCRDFQLFRPKHCQSFALLP